MSKVEATFHTKAAEYGKLIRKYDAALVAARTAGWTPASERKLAAIGKEMDKLRGPLHAALEKFARKLEA